MAYNKSRAVVMRNEKLLKRLAMERRSVQIPSEKPANLAYRIREALEAVKFHDDYDRQYGDLRDVYRVKSFDKFVEIRYLGDKPSEVPPAQPDSDEAKTEETVSEAEAPNAVMINNVTDLLGVIGTAIKLGERTEEIFFPDAVIPLHTERLKLYAWCTAKGWKYIDHEGAGITLTKNEVDPFLLWEPEEDAQVL